MSGATEVRDRLRRKLLIISSDALSRRNASALAASSIGAVLQHGSGITVEGDAIAGRKPDAIGCVLTNEDAKEVENGSCSCS